MKNSASTLLFVFFISFLLVPCANAVHVNITPEQKVLNSKVTTLYGVPFHTQSNVTVRDILSHSPSEFSKKYDVPLSLKQKIVYRLAQVEYRYKLGNGDYDLSMMPSNNSGFTFVGFLLGFFLLLIGVLIAWIVWGNRGLRSSMYGMLLSFILFIIGYRARR